MGLVKCLKYTMIALNTLFLLMGIGFLAGGAYVYKDGTNYGISPTVAIGVIILGIVVFLLSLLGIIGAWKGNKVILWIVRALEFTCRIPSLRFAFLVLTRADPIALSVLYAPPHHRGRPVRDRRRCLPLLGPARGHPLLVVAGGPQCQDHDQQHDQGHDPELRWLLRLLQLVGLPQYAVPGQQQPLAPRLPARAHGRLRPLLQVPPRLGLCRPCPPGMKETRFEFFAHALPIP